MDDLSLILSRLRDGLLLSDSAAVEAQASPAQRWVASLQVDGRWGDIDYADQNTGPWKPAEHLNRALALARLYHAPGHALSQDAQLRECVLAAISFWLISDFQNANWWYNQVGVPMAIGALLVLMSSELAPQQLRAGLAILERGTLRDATGANLAWAVGIQLTRGCLAGSSALVAEAAQAFFAELTIAEPGQEGVQADFSFHQHGALLNSGGYGQAFTYEAARFVTDAYGTRFAAPAERVAVLSGHILDGQQWMMRGAAIDYGTIGRQIARPGQDGRLIVECARSMAQLPLARREELAAFAARADGAASPLVGNRHFWKSDFMAQHRVGYYTSVRMVSARTFNTDAFITGEARHSRHLADGVTYIFRTGEEYRDIFPVWDWRRVPGVTCEQRGEPLDLSGLHMLGPTSFVGGVSDGLYGLAAMDMRQELLTAKKAWFYFDEQFVCLGAGLTCPTGNPVYTSVNQCLRRSPVTIGGSPIRLEDQAPFEHALDGGWAHHDGVGYVCPSGAAAIVAARQQTGSWGAIGAGSAEPLTHEVFSVWIDHGRNPADQSFAYIVFPDSDPQVLAEQAEDNQIKILSNTPALQSVRHTGIKLCGAAFYEPGRLAGDPGWNILVDQPCLLLLRELVDGVQLAVANPENQPLIVNVDVDRALVGDSCAPLRPGWTRVTVALPAGAEAGRNDVRVLRTEN
jgi:chondroitin AC lyase